MCVKNFFSTNNLLFMARKWQKTAIFSSEFWPFFYIFHRLRPYSCSKRGVLGFYKQVTYRRPCDEPFFTSGSKVEKLQTRYSLKRTFDEEKGSISFSASVRPEIKQKKNNSRLGRTHAKMLSTNQRSIDED